MGNSVASSAPLVDLGAHGDDLLILHSRRGDRARLRCLDSLAALAGVTTTLVLRSDHVAGCICGFVIAGLGIQQVLAPGGQTTIRLGRPAAGTLRYTCATGMYSGATPSQGTRGIHPTWGGVWYGSWTRIRSRW